MQSVITSPFGRINPWVVLSLGDLRHRNLLKCLPVPGEKVGAKQLRVSGRNRENPRIWAPTEVVLVKFDDVGSVDLRWGSEVWLPCFVGDL